MCPWFDPWRYHLNPNSHIRVFCFKKNVMSHFIYLLFSKTTSKYYIGETHNVEERIKNHNQHYYLNSYSKIANDWELVLSFECIDRSTALYLEKFIKKMKSRVFIQKIIANPEILSDILSKKINPCVPGSPEASGLEVPLKPE